jgi:transcriptional regulator with XRE-family HTH domain
MPQWEHDVFDLPVQLAHHQVGESRRASMPGTRRMDYPASAPTGGLIINHVLTVAPNRNRRDLSVSPLGCSGKQATNREGAMNRADFAAELARRRAAAGLSLADLAKRAHLHRGYAGNVEHGHRWPTETVARALDSALDAGGELLDTWKAANRAARTQTRSGDQGLVELLELAARAEASDVSLTTLDLLDCRVDTMARTCTRLPPAELLREVRTSAGQIGRLLDGRATLAQRRRLLTSAG